MDVTQQNDDRALMARCIALSRQAVADGEYPFASLIGRGAEVLTEATNATLREGDVTRHAEVLAISAAQKALGKTKLRGYTLYTNVEPCAMCSYCIREAQLDRVVFSLASPVMGGLSKWNILCDDGIADRIPQIFGPVPEVVSGLLLREAEQVWRDWQPLAWPMIQLLGLLAKPDEPAQVVVRPRHRPKLWHVLTGLFHRSG